MTYACMYDVWTWHGTYSYDLTSETCEAINIFSILLSSSNSDIYWYNMTHRPSHQAHC